MVQCPECDNEYDKIGLHWGASCDPPELTEKQRQIATGVLMGDGSLYRNGRNAALCVNSHTNEQYLDYLDEEFGIYGLGVRSKQTAQEAAEYNKKSGNSPRADPENYSDQYSWMTRRSEVFNRYKDWYRGSNKSFPNDLILTPISLAHWYVCDGHLQESRGEKYMTISITNERNSFDKIESIFNQSGLPIPVLHDHNIFFNQQGTRVVFDWLDGPIPGFEDKWPDEYK